MADDVKKQPFLARFSWFNKLKGIKHIEIIVVVVLGVIICLIWFADFGSGGGAAAGNTSYTAMSASQYARELETKLNTVLSNINGAGKVTSMVTLESSSELKIASSTEERTNSSTTGNNKTESITVVETPIIIDFGGSKMPLVLMEIMPKVTGVIVVAQGAADVRVRLEMLKAIQALFNVPPGSIEIFVGK
ncbi:MAG: hypothetical protein FWE53_04625 [Firmicutes bacterium]|nr:hypothetical protein [Bacillota bacterium]